MQRIHLRRCQHHFSLLFVVNLGGNWGRFLFLTHLIPTGTKQVHLAVMGPPDADVYFRSNICIFDSQQLRINDEELPHDLVSQSFPSGLMAPRLYWEPAAAAQRPHSAASSSSLSLSPVHTLTSTWPLSHHRRQQTRLSGAPSSARLSEVGVHPPFIP